ncbi:uncharacterized protein [Spinacia oleracea]|uniref:Ubiquitin-like protease family profile domain-containing protein n=1 Tax=Spinacia oleracea TaxID=3562 RepID=A0ABM3R268_SPIOL|nr:uncharacterized protein LOC130464223 [Spinacia oleracea]
MYFNIVFKEKRVEVARNSKLKGKDPVVDEEMKEDEEGRSLSWDDSEESVFDGDAYEDVEDDEYEDEIYEDEEFEDELCQRTVKRAPKKRQSAKSRRVISYDEVEEEEDIEEEDGEYMDGGYEDEGEDVVVRVQKRGKSWKEVGQNALKKKAHLQMMRKRRREDYDDVDEGRRPVKKTILPAMEQMGRKFDETGVAKGKPPAKQKAIRGNNRRMFVRVPIPKHPMSRGEYAKFHGVVVATQRANCGRKVYVPVVDNGHWWCVAFALKDQKIWFIDSMYTNPASEHSGDVKKLIAAVEYVLHWRDTQYHAALVWKLKQMHTWPLDSISFPDYNDNHACGIVMLMAIQESARAFTKTMQVGDINVARKALFLSHLNSDFNSCRPLLPQIVATHCPLLSFDTHIIPRRWDSLLAGCLVPLLEKFGYNLRVWYSLNFVPALHDRVK